MERYSNHIVDCFCVPSGLRFQSRDSRDPNTPSAFPTESVSSRPDDRSVVREVAVEMAEIQSAPAAVRDALRFLDAVDLRE